MWSWGDEEMYVSAINCFKMAASGGTFICSPIFTQGIPGSSKTQYLPTDQAARFKSAREDCSANLQISNLFHCMTLRMHDFPCGNFVDEVSKLVLCSSQNKRTRWSLVNCYHDLLSSHWFRVCGGALVVVGKLCLRVFQMFPWSSCVNLLSPKNNSWIYLKDFCERLEVLRCAIPKQDSRRLVTTFWGFKIQLQNQGLWCQNLMQKAPIRPVKTLFWIEAEDIELRKIDHQKLAMLIGWTWVATSMQWTYHLTPGGLKLYQSIFWYFNCFNKLNCLQCLSCALMLCGLKDSLRWSCT